MGTKVAVEGDKTTNSSSKTTKTSAAESAPLPDYVKYVAALDAKEYHACYSKLVDVRNTYVKAKVNVCTFVRAHQHRPGLIERTRASRCARCSVRICVALV